MLSFISLQSFHFLSHSNAQCCQIFIWYLRWWVVWHLQPSSSSMPHHLPFLFTCLDQLPQSSLSFSTVLTYFRIHLLPFPLITNFIFISSGKPSPSSTSSIFMPFFAVIITLLLILSLLSSPQPIFATYHLIINILISFNVCCHHHNMFQS